MTNTGTYNFALKISKSKLPFAIAILGLIMIVFYYLLSPRNILDKIWHGYLIAIWFLLNIGIFGLLFITIHHITKAKWSESILPVAHRISRTVPIISLLFLPLFLFRDKFYYINAEQTGFRQVFMDPSFVFMRTVFVLLILTFIYFRFKKYSNSAEHNTTTKKISVLFIVLFLPLFFILCQDWVMFLHKDFSSSIFVFYQLSGLLLGGISVLIIFVFLSNHKNQDPKHFKSTSYDLGRYLLALSMIWFYIWFSQKLIIWYADIPEETGFYGFMKANGIIMKSLSLALNIVVPFCLLLFRKIKENLKMITLISSGVVIGRLVDISMSVINQNSYAQTEFILLLSGVFFLISAILVLVEKYMNFTK